MNSNRPLGHPEPWPAPGKLNLFLHLLGRRADGYHRLQTAFQFIDLCDELRFHARPPGVIELLHPLPGVPPEQNLVHRAAAALAALAAPEGLGPGVAIELRKRLPMQGGVGGGSSDAATTLVALDRLWRLDLGPQRLAELGAGLGADVPVFLGQRAAWAEGIGEVLTPFDFPAPHYLLLRPDAAVSTAEVFQSPDLTRDSAPIKIAGFLDGGGRNDCEAVVRRRAPAVAEALDWLRGFGPARLTGTGACVFLPLADADAGYAIADRAPGRWQTFVVRGLNRSPLTQRLRHEAG